MAEQTLRRFIKRGLQNQGVIGASVRTDTIYVFEEEGEMDLIWWVKEDAQPVSKLPGSEESVEFEKYSLTTQVETAIAPTEPLVAPIESQIQVTEESPDGGVEPNLSEFSDTIDEVIIGIDEFAEIIMGYDEKDWVNLVGVSAYSTERSQALDTAFNNSERGYSIREYVDERGE